METHPKHLLCHFHGNRAKDNKPQPRAQTRTSPISITYMLVSAKKSHKFENKYEIFKLDLEGKSLPSKTYKQLIRHDVCLL